MVVGSSLPKKATRASFARRKKIGLAIKKLREERDLSVMEAAVAAGVSFSTWTRWESGKTAIPLELVADIAKALDGVVLDDAIRPYREVIDAIHPYLVAA